LIRFVRRTCLFGDGCRNGFDELGVARGHDVVGMAVVECELGGCDYVGWRNVERASGIETDDLRWHRGSLRAVLRVYINSPGSERRQFMDARGYRNTDTLGLLSSHVRKITTPFVDDP